MLGDIIITAKVVELLHLYKTNTDLQQNSAKYLQ